MTRQETTNRLPIIFRFDQSAVMNLPLELMEAIRQSETVILVVDRAMKPMHSFTEAAAANRQSTTCMPAPPSACRPRGIKRRKTPPTCRWTSSPTRSHADMKMPKLPERVNALPAFPILSDFDAESDNDTIPQLPMRKRTSIDGELCGIISSVLHVSETTGAVTESAPCRPLPGFPSMTLLPQLQ